MSEPLARELPDTRKKDAIILRDAMKELLASEGWRMVSSFLLGQTAIRQQKLLEPCGGQDQAYAQEYMKGEAAAFKIAAAVPERLLRSAEETMALLEQGEDLPDEEIEDV